MLCILIFILRSPVSQCGIVIVHKQFYKMGIVTLQAILALDEPVDNTIEFQCSITTHDTFNMAESILHTYTTCNARNRTRRKYFLL